MKRCSRCKNEKPITEFHASSRGYLGVQSNCKECASIIGKERYADKRERVLATNTSWNLRNTDKMKSYSNKYSLRNRHKRTSLENKRRAQKLLATPKWADTKLIDEFYFVASAMSKEFGAEYQVDHITPLNSKIVCGLHTEANLQVILKIDNIKKGNRYWPNMP